MRDMGKKFTFEIPLDHVVQVRELQSSYEEEVWDIAQEECAEMIQAISKIKRCKAGTIEFREDLRDNLIEEMSHVLVQMAELAVIADITNEDLRWQWIKKAEECGFNVDSY